MPEPEAPGKKIKGDFMAVMVGGFPLVHISFPPPIVTKETLDETTDAILDAALEMMQTMVGRCVPGQRCPQGHHVLIFPGEARCCSYTVVTPQRFTFVFSFHTMPALDCKLMVLLKGPGVDADKKAMN